MSHYRRSYRSYIKYFKIFSKLCLFELLHTILYLKYAQKNNYMIDELPLLVKISDCNYNPIIYEMDA